MKIKCEIANLEWMYKQIIIMESQRKIQLIRKDARFECFVGIVEIISDCVSLNIPICIIISFWMWPFCVVIAMHYSFMRQNSSKIMWAETAFTAFINTKCLNKGIFHLSFGSLKLALNSNDD